MANTHTWLPPTSWRLCQKIQINFLKLLIINIWHILEHRFLPLYYCGGVQCILKYLKLVHVVHKINTLPTRNIYIYTPIFMEEYCTWTQLYRCHMMWWLFLYVYTRIDFGYFLSVCFKILYGLWPLDLNSHALWMSLIYKLSLRWALVLGPRPIKLCWNQ